MVAFTCFYFETQQFNPDLHVATQNHHWKNGQIIRENANADRSDAESRTHVATTIIMHHRQSPPWLFISHISAVMVTPFAWSDNITTTLTSPWLEPCATETEFPHCRTSPVKKHHTTLTSQWSELSATDTKTTYPDTKILTLLNHLVCMPLVKQVSHLHQLHNGQGLLSLRQRQLPPLVKQYHS